MAMLTERIDKLEAARRQMVEAIRLFFEHRDSVAIHTLASAAAQLLSDLCTKEGVVPLCRGGGYIREDRKKEWNTALKNAENFFKHADRDPEGCLDFNVEQTECTLLDCTFMYGQLSRRQTYEGRVFQSWFYLKYPDVLLDSDLKTRIVAEARRLAVHSSDRSFFADIIKLRDRLPPGQAQRFD